MKYSYLNHYKKGLKLTRKKNLISNLSINIKRKVLLGSEGFTEFIFKWIDLKYFKGIQKKLFVCDLGSGQCTFYPANVRDNKKWIFHAVDLGDNMKESIQLRGINFFVGNIEGELDFLKTNTYSFVICSHVIEHLHNPEKVIQTIYRMLEPGGIAIIKTPDISSIKFDFFGDYTHIRPFTLNSLKTLCSNYDLEIIESNSINHEFSILKKAISYRFNILSLIIFLIYFIKNINPKNRELEILLKKPIKSK